MLISVIVPVYNIEKYIGKAIETIIGQTYRDLEIILVDDGSTDRSGEICEFYAGKDDRIVVVHQENGGLSKARNTGTKIAKGDAIAFIDGDDYIHPCYFEILAKNLTEHDADISVCGMQVVSEDEYSKLMSVKNVEDSAIDISSKEAIEGMLYQKLFSLSSCAKLYKRKIAKSHCFPERELFEDYYTVYRFFTEATAVTYTDARLYYYLKRAGSITKKKYSHQMMDYIKHGEQVTDHVERNGRLLFDAAISRLVWACFYIVTHIDDSSKYREDEEYCWNYIKKYRRKVIKDKSAVKKEKILCALSMFGKRPLKLVYKMSLR